FFSLKDFATTVIDNGENNALSAFQLAVNSGEIITIPPTAYSIKLDGTVEVNNPITIKGSRGSSKITRTGSSAGFSVKSDDCTFDGLFLDGAGLTAQSFDFILATQTKSIYRTLIKDVRTRHSRGFMADENYSATTPRGHVVYDLKVKGCHHMQHKGPGYKIYDGIAFLVFRDVYVELIHNDMAQNFIGYDMRNMEGLFMDRVEATGSWNIDVGTSNAQIGFNITNGAAVHLNSVFADNFGGQGMIFNTINYLHGTELTSSINNLEGINMDVCQKVKLGVVHVSGRRSITGDKANSVGFAIGSGCVDVTIGVVETQDCVSAGLASYGQRVNIGTLTTHHNGTYGYVAEGETGDSLCVGLNAHDNVTGSYYLGNTANNHIAAFHGPSKDFTASITGPASE
ncbi:hypothetical protein IL59_0214975, partial [Brucella suis bv. 4 str. 40]